MKNPNNILIRKDKQNYVKKCISLEVGSTGVRKELFLDNDDIKAIRTSKITGSDFLNYSIEDFRECGLQVGPAQRITKLSEELRPKICNVTFKYRVKENKTVECNRRDRIVLIIYYSLTELTLKLLQEHVQKEFKFLATTHDEIVIKYNKSILSNDVTMRSIFKTKENIELIVTLDKKCFSSYKNLREVLQKHGIDNDEVRSILVFFPNCENEENYKEEFEDCVKEIKARLSAIGNVGDQNKAQRSHFITSILVSAVNSAPNTILRLQFEIIGDWFEEIIYITEAKQIDIKVEVAQNLMQLEGLLDSNKNKKHKLDELYPDQAYSEYVYGIVSTGTDWYFLKHTPDQIFCSQVSDHIPLVTTQLNNDEDLRKGIKTVLGKIIWILKDRDRSNKRQRT
ncbi:crinkler family protein [Gigaspora margarita]|uniref:Crinkler family protein n=1 Tax=Gigaspora margarita TaxID=4874 RepID=A0A8H4EIQ9_GIGMA|nr:crinkler family protein [Gigaspora margarita]